ncbi:M10 family metallopeptidase C-terminal domain-containing protein [Methylobacterium sp. Leaf108]|uniref:M10 family metallopeptidase C-terminal domain-containing protein n=1 Tax=Methylobacterium sp. Leaf108 TaxID=1736256 RepID=UPI0006FEFE2E|nr:M10 family metallopeptidase C-terminal domain-containing protein [Methylobacterium sp. Leaf108]KQP54901.1 hypothetical protein ASF39_03860 [Methylobacterium sp. Leaf108]
MCVFCGQTHPTVAYALGSGSGTTATASEASGTATFTSVSRTADVDVNGLLYGTKWAGTALTVSFPDVYDDYGTGYYDQGAASRMAVLTAAQQTAARAVLANVAAVSNLALTEIAETASVHANIRLANSGAPSTSYAYLPGSSLSGDVFFGNIAGSVPVAGTYAYHTYLHEIGHALGLKHGHDTGSFGAISRPMDAMEYSVMTYRSYVGAPLTGYRNESIGYAQSLMMLDIAALQALYGADYTTQAGDTVYSFSATTGVMSIDGVAQDAVAGNRVFRTIWDGGGNDTYDFSNYTTHQTIDLGAGAGSTMSTAQIAYLGGPSARANLYNALLFAGNVASLIENAVGGAGNDLITGNQAANTLSGGAGNDTLDGGIGDDTLIGGAGDDTYRLGDAGDVVTELAGGGTDTVLAAFGLTLADDIENATLTGTAAVNATGNALANLLTGNAAANVLDGGAGNDTLDGGAGADALTGGLGDDVYVVDSTGDTVTELAGAGMDTVRAGIAYVLGLNLENLVLTGTASVAGTGNGLANALTGNAGANLLDGITGADTLAGGAGNDTYIVDGDDVVVEGAGGGTDTVRSSGSHVLGSEVEVLVLTGTAAIDGTGNALANTLTGNAGANVLDGGIGADRMAGGAGDDTYRVDATGDVVTELANGGTDTVSASVGYVLLANLENLTLTGNAAIDATGNMLANVLTGNAAANRLDGGLGADTMAGGLGDDTYRVDNLGDVVTEASNGGTDRVEASVGHTLGGDVEILTLTGTGAISGTGNGLANLITGNGGANLVDGAAGDDTMAGGLGNDTYRVDSAGDIVIELTAGGIDTVEAAASYVLGAQVEYLVLTGSAAIGGTGNALANRITGNGAGNTLTGDAGDDTLDGGAGDDVLVGGLGNDTYRIDSASDVVTEAAGGGTDTVEAAATYTLGDAIEGLVLVGAAAIAGTGNVLANAIAGNTAANRIDAGDGNDTLDGGAGADTLVGGLGDDTFRVDAAGDVVTEAAGEGTDTVIATVGYILSGEVEALTLAGSAAINGTGNGLANLITGNIGANILDGGAGSDTLAGGLGDDTYRIDTVADVVIEAAAAGTDTVQASFDVTLGANLENLQLLGSAAVNGTGNALANAITGNAGANLIDGGAGADRMAGGLGDDVYRVDNAGDIVTETASGGTDTVQAGISATLSAFVENLTLTGSLAISGTGNTLANRLVGNGAANTLDGASGADTMVGGAGNDIYRVDSALDVTTELAGEGTDTVLASTGYTLGDNVENLTLGGTAALSGTGNALSNLVTGNAGANLLDGGAGADTLAGGLGNDTYRVDDAGDVVTEIAGGGTDTVETLVSLTLAAQVEALTLAGSAAIDGTGNALSNLLTGNDAANVLDGAGGDDTFEGGAGADTLIGGLGNDSYRVGAGDVITEAAGGGIDTVLSAITWTLAGEIETLTLTGTGAVDGTGNALSNRITGNAAANTLAGDAGNDTLDGGAGADTLVGGLGDDTYRIVDSGDVVTELTGGGIDTVEAALSLVLADFVENLVLTGVTALSGTGNGLANRLTGNAGANLIDGGAGADTMAGGLGNDTYRVDDSGDVVVELAGGGSDLVETGLSHTLSAQVENLTLTGSGAIDGTGNALANVITGNAAANVLDGGAGSDRMAGGLGDDTYLVDMAADAVIEAAGGGTDTVRSSASVTLALNVENLTLVGTAAIAGTGNALANVIFGNGAANSLDGGLGADSMAGGLGNDTYRVDSAGDVVTEAAASGTDTVLTAFSYTLSDHVEALTLTGSLAADATGNGLANVITGNGAANVLDGGAGADTIIGGAGNDTYVLDSLSDVVSEGASAGTDSVRSAVTHTLGANVENLTLLGSADIDGSGNALANRILGNDAVNALSGAAGDDVLRGAGGDDRLTGGLGRDIFTYDAFDFGADTILDFLSGTDRIDLRGSGIDAVADVSFAASGGDLLISFAGVDDTITLAGLSSLQLAASDLLFA